MVVSKKVDRIINKGADVKADKKGWTNFNLRIREDMITGIEQALEETVGLTKTGWILQAIQDKLRRKDEL